MLCYLPKGGSKVTHRHRVLLVLLLIGIQCLTIGSALAQTRGGAITVRYAAFSPFIALLAGIFDYPSTP